MEIEIIDYFIIPVILIIGIITSWEDFYIGRVRNKWLKFGLIYGLVFFTFFILKNALFPHLGYSIGLDIKFSYIYLAKVYSNTCISILIGFYMWKKGLFAAGDAKLFMLIAFLLPLKYYWKSYLPYFPSFALLLNIFLPIFAVILYYAFHAWTIKSIKYLREYKEIDFTELRNKFNSAIILYLKMLAGFISTFLILAFFLDQWIPLTYANGSYMFLFSMFARQQIYSYFKKQKLLFWLFFFAFFIIIFNIITDGLSNSMTMLFFMVRMVIIFNTLFIVLNLIIDNYVGKTRIKMKIEDLRPGIMVILDKMPKPEIGMIKGGGISEAQVKLLKEWGGENNYKEIETFKNLPFAIWIFVGTIITIIFNKSVIHMVFELF